MPHASLVYSRHRTSLSTRSGAGVNEGTVKGTRWEWGIGKGQWKRAVKRAARELGMEGHTRATYLLVCSRYRIGYNGKAAASQLYESL